MLFNYERLRQAIKKRYKSQSNFAEELGICYVALNHRLNNLTQWKTEDIVVACQLLDIPLERAHEYFFVQKF